MTNIKVIDLRRPRVASPREHLGTLCFEDVVPIDPKHRVPKARTFGLKHVRSLLVSTKR